MMKKIIHIDHNGVVTNAITCLDDGKIVDGHNYEIIYGFNQKLDINFQNGAVRENGVNGVTNEALLAILIDRTSTLNDKFPCDENVRAINDMKNALANLEVRSARRIVRGVEGLDVA